MSIIMNNKMDASAKFEALRKELEKRHISAIQNGDFSQLREGQLHHLRDDYGMSEVFVLITKVSNLTCSVIPGSFYAMHGGPDDLVLPKSVLGDYVTLSMDLATELPFKAIGKGFASLDDVTYKTVLRSFDDFSGKSVEGDTFSYALPYIGESDRRIAYHRHLDEVIDKARNVAVDCRENEAAASSTFQRLNQFQENVITIWRHEPCLSAAAASEKNDVHLEFEVQEKALVLQIEYSRAEKKIIANVFDKSGDNSNGLDGCQLLGVKYAVQGTIKDGHAEIAFPDDVEDCQLCLVTEDGLELVLESIRQ